MKSFSDRVRVLSLLSLCFGFVAITDAEDSIDFAREVQPILAKRCFACHGPDEAEGGLAFHDSQLALVEAESGDYAIVPGAADESRLLDRITSDDEYERMPPEGDPLSLDEVSLIRRWIEQGATFTKHWAFESMSRRDRSGSDADTRGSTARNPIDDFIDERLLNAGLSSNPPADRASLVRRLSYGLTGLPPTVGEIDSFVNDPSDEAYAKVVERLLASPHYGERWGRHWLDLVRFAETNSFERDNAKPNAWRYRDYVIRSFNNDKPYDQFIREQLAGDLLKEVTTETQVATGYYRLGIWDDEPADPLQAYYDEMDDLITTTGQVFLGLTINCARCHDHKIDPIPQTDYYSLLAFFADVTTYGTRRDQISNNQIDVTAPEVATRYQELDDLQRVLEEEKTSIEQAGIAKMDAPDQRATEGPKRDRERVLKDKLEQNLAPEQWDRYQTLKSEIADAALRERELPPRERVLGLAQRKPIEPTHVFYRGNPHSPAEEVSPRFPTLFEEAPPEDGEKRRLILANWIASKNNRLTARVMANRIWQYHFGRGIVRSSNNFGQLGTPPTHPELLDHLAHAFMDSGWSVKELHRLILTSQAYQRSAIASPEAMARDPQNDLFWRFDPRRLSAEEVRDSILQVNGTLNRATYGPSVFPELSEEVLAGQSKPGKGWTVSNASDQDRRSVYIHVKRSLLLPMLSAFDFPDPDRTCEARFATLQPGQALSLLNSDFIQQESRILTASVLDGLAEQDREDITRFVGSVVQRVLTREATPRELDAGRKLIQDLVDQHELSLPEARQLYALSVLNWNEFAFVF